MNVTLPGFIHVPATPEAFAIDIRIEHIMAIAWRPAYVRLALKDGSQLDFKNAQRDLFADAWEKASRQCLRSNAAEN